MLEKSKSLYNVEMITVFQRRNNISLSSLNQPRNLKLKQPWFWVDKKTFLLLCYTVWEIVICTLTFKRLTVFQCRKFNVEKTMILGWH